ncbi:hypothetical protein Tco_0635056 [Tanacetum coccineum]
MGKTDRCGWLELMWNQFSSMLGRMLWYQNEYNAVQNSGIQVVSRCIQNQGVTTHRIGSFLLGTVQPTREGEMLLIIRHSYLMKMKEVNANCILMANLQQASTSGTQTDKAPVYDSDGSAEVHNYDNCYDNEIFNMFTQEEQYTEILEPTPEPHQVQQNDNVISDISCVEQEGGTVDQHTATVEETRAYFESLYNNLALEVEKVNSVNRN